jgi:hypothetical protein
MMKLKIFLIGVLFPAAVFAQKAPSLDALQDGIHHWNLLHPDRTYARYAEKDYEKIADNLIAYQNEDGGWLKNMDWAGVLNIERRAEAEYA